MDQIEEESARAVTIVNAENHSFELNEENLNKILLDSNVKDKKVVVLSVAGAFRKGKSFLLNFLLRYLEAKGDENWLGDEVAPLKGFSWRGGSERDTTGIMMWSKPFSVTLPSGEEVAVLLMDTQGSFDSTATVKECATVFALSTMLSSIQVYNISQNIQEDDLQHLELFTDYGRLAMENSDEKPFQKLIFLVRDWSFPYEADYGEIGGKKILDRRLETSENQHVQLQQLRRHIRNCFSEVACFLMPHPGLDVATSPEFDGRLSVIREEFKTVLNDLVKVLLSPKSVIPKHIGGVNITAKDLITYFKAYVEIFKGGELPEPKSMLDATAEANNLSALARSKEFYTNEMDKICGGDHPYVNHEELERSHFEIRQHALQMFSETKKMGSEDLEHTYLQKLTKEIDEAYKSLDRFNDAKQIANAVRTPGTLFIIAIVCYFNSMLFASLGMESFAVSINFIMFLSVISIFLWGYTRFTGEMPQVGLLIDSFVSVIHNNFIIPSQKHFAQILDHQKHSMETSSSDTAHKED